MIIIYIVQFNSTVCSVKGLFKDKVGEFLLPFPMKQLKCCQRLSSVVLEAAEKAPLINKKNKVLTSSSSSSNSSSSPSDMSSPLSSTPMITECSVSLLCVKQEKDKK